MKRMALAQTTKRNEKRQIKGPTRPAINVTTRHQTTKKTKNQIKSQQQTETVFTKKI